MKTHMRVTCTLLLLFLLVSLLSACDSGLKYVKMEVETLPEKTVYYVGEDTALQFDGGTVKLTTADGSTSIEDMQSYTVREDPDQGISSNVNFSLPGTYTVTIQQTKGIFCHYVIEVRAR